MANVFIEEQYMSEIADAIRNRTGKTDSIYPENMSEEILSIGADATATENDMANGVTAYVDGEIVTGKLQTIEYDGKYYGWTNGTARTMNDGTIGVGKLIDDGDVLYRNGAGVAVSAPASEFGDALPEDVASGKIFTSASGLKVSGELQEGAPTSYFGLNRDDTTLSYGEILLDDMFVLPYIEMTGIAESDVLCRAGTTYNLRTMVGNFGDAKQSDVVAGKTFTSTYGIKITGTASMNNGSIVKTGTTTSSTINTGLSEIKAFFLDCSANSGAGLCTLSYSSDLEYMTLYGRSSYAQAVTRVSSSSNDYFSVSGGTATIKASSSTSYAFRSNVTYSWVAIGTE